MHYYSTTQKLLYLIIEAGSNVISFPTEVKRDPEKLPDAMIFFTQKPTDTQLHYVAMMTRDLSEQPTGVYACYNHIRQYPVPVAQHMMRRSAPLGAVSWIPVMWLTSMCGDFVLA